VQDIRRDRRGDRRGHERRAPSSPLIRIQISYVHLKLKKSLIEANVENGTKRTAVWFSFSANKDHGFPRQPGAAKEIIKKILADEEWSETSLQGIAEWVGVTHPYVSKVKAEVQDQSQNRTILSGNQLPDRNPDTEPKTQILRAATLKVKRGDQEYTMKNTDVEHRPQLDATGKEVPEHLVEIFSRAKELKIIVHELNKILHQVKTAKADEDRLYAYVNLNRLEMDMGNVKRVFRFGIPYAVCRYCGGDVNNDNCRVCGGLGFVNETGYQVTLKELK